MIEDLNTFWTQFHFLRPYWLLGFFLIFFMNYKLQQCRLQQSSWRKYCDPKLLQALIIGDPTKDPKLPFVLMLIGWCLTLIALAGPTWTQSPKVNFRDDLARVIILDASRSMLTDDIKPNRFTRAKHKVTDILDLPFSGETALIVYAYSAFVVTPLTEDTSNIKALLPSINPNIMPAQGSRPALALAKALNMLSELKVTHAQVILITDNAEDKAVFQRAKQIRQAGYEFSVLSVGSDRGGKIRLHDGEWLQHAGSVVTTRMDGVSLRNLAIEGGGRYSTLTTDDSDVQYLLAPLAKPQDLYKRTNESTQVWYEQGPWLITLVLPLALFAFRRGWFGILLLGFMPFSIPSNTQAFELSALWLNQNQQGAIALSANRLTEAARLFQSRPWRGVALYRAGKFEQAASVFAQTSSVESLYNQGNALAFSRKLRPAIHFYTEVLKRNPSHKDARYNKKLLQSYLQKNPDFHAQSSNVNTSSDGEGAGSSPDEQAEKSQQNDGQADETKSIESQPQHKPMMTQKETEQNKPQESQPSTYDLTDQWLQHIPDDPGGLLRQKFLSQAKKQYALKGDGVKPW